MTPPAVLPLNSDSSSKMTNFTIDGEMCLSQVLNDWFWQEPEIELLGALLKHINDAQFDAFQMVLASSVPRIKQPIILLDFQAKSLTSKLSEIGDYKGGSSIMCNMILKLTRSIKDELIPLKKLFEQTFPGDFECFKSFSRHAHEQIIRTILEKLDFKQVQTGEQLVTVVRSLQVLDCLLKSFSFDESIENVMCMLMPQIDALIQHRLTWEILDTNLCHFKHVLEAFFIHHIEDSLQELILETKDAAIVDFEWMPEGIPMELVRYPCLMKCAMAVAECDNNIKSLTEIKKNLDVLRSSLWERFIKSLMENIVQIPIKLPLTEKLRIQVEEQLIPFAQRRITRRSGME